MKLAISALIKVAYIQVGGLHGEAEGIRIGKRIGHAQ